MSIVLPSSIYAMYCLCVWLGTDCALMVKTNSIFERILAFWLLISWHFRSPKRKFYFNVDKETLCYVSNRGDRSTPMGKMILYMLTDAEVRHCAFLRAIHFKCCSTSSFCWTLVSSLLKSSSTSTPCAVSASWFLNHFSYFCNLYRNYCRGRKNQGRKNNGFKI